MNALTNGDALSTIVDLGLKGLFILAGAECLLSVAGRLSASRRSAIRFIALVSLAFLPLAQIWRPARMGAVVTVRSEPVSGNQIALGIELPHLAKQKRERTEVSTPASPSSASVQANGLRLHQNVAGAASILWAAVAFLTLVPLGAGLFERRRLRRRCTLESDRPWLELMDGLRTEAGIRRPVQLLRCTDALVPMTWGSLRPTVLLPASADQWSAQKRRAVLGHELGHIRRWDCLTQLVARVICALYWFNPLAWRFARAMRLESEQACDDLVLQSRATSTDYATYLVEIASHLRLATSNPALGLPMARPSQLERRISALLNASRSRGPAGWRAWLGLSAAALLTVTALAAQKSFSKLREAQLARLKTFAAQKEQHAEGLLELSKAEFFPEFRKFFAAAKSGDSQTVTNMYANFKRRHGQYGGVDDLPHTPYWNTVLEVCLAYADVTWGEPEHVQLAIDGFLESIPKGAVYFGGTDPGRGLPTAFSKNHAEANPFYTLTQNALADATYLEYLRATYGSKIEMPTDEDSQAAFRDYVKDATERYHAGKLKPNENVRIEGTRTSVSGIVAVMQINARLAKAIFDKNPGRSFFIEESFPLDWMYPHLTPSGQVMKINRDPLPTLRDEIVQKDIAFWNGRVKRFFGEGLNQGETMDRFLNRMDAIYVKHNLPRGADPKFFSNDWAQRAFSKWRSGSAGIYAWRATHDSSESERKRMTAAAEFALRQSYALCPNSPEVVHRYSKLLLELKRQKDAIALVKLSLEVEPENAQLEDELAKTEAGVE